jgi:hypothetical protein
MKIKKFLIFFLIFTFTFAKVSQAQVQPPPIATTYKQGIYDISQYSGKFVTAKLITPNEPLTVIAFDSMGNQRLLLRLTDPNEFVKLGYINKGDVVVIIGKGEIAFSPVQ